MDRIYRREFRSELSGRGREASWGWELLQRLRGSRMCALWTRILLELGGQQARLRADECKRLAIGGSLLAGPNRRKTSKLTFIAIPKLWTRNMACAARRVGVAKQIF